MVMADIFVGGVIFAVIALAAFVAVREYRKGNTCGKCNACGKVKIIQIDDGRKGNE